MDSGHSNSIFIPEDERDVVPYDKEEIFEEVYSKYHGRVCNFLTRKVGNAEDALDLAQEVYMIFYRRMEKLNVYHPRLESWLFRVGQNLSFSYNRRKANRVTNQMGNAEFSSETDDNYVSLQKQELYNQLNDFLGSLTDRERSIFILHKIEKIKYNDLMTIFNISPRTLKRIISSIMLKLRQNKIIDRPDFDI